MQQILSIELKQTFWPCARYYKSNFFAVYKFQTFNTYFNTICKAYFSSQGTNIQPKQDNLKTFLWGILHHPTNAFSMSPGIFQDHRKDSDVIKIIRCLFQILQTLTWWVIKRQQVNSLLQCPYNSPLNCFRGSSTTCEKWKIDLESSKYLPIFLHRT